MKQPFKSRSIYSFMIPAYIRQIPVKEYGEPFVDSELWDGKILKTHCSKKQWRD